MKLNSLNNGSNCVDTCLYTIYIDCVALVTVLVCSKCILVTIQMKDADTKMFNVLLISVSFFSLIQQTVNVSVLLAY